VPQSQGYIQENLAVAEEMFVSLQSIASPKVSIIILNWNGLEDTIECLESLKKITYLNYEVIVVDNGSPGVMPRCYKRDSVIASQDDKD
jgi:cellulose synthase/poly-beta-1,6-N-acetylglucosamine synthase-like glycosyltransferase